MTDLVSVIIPLYNVERYIDACLWSVRRQTHADVEIVVVNDVTPDRSMDIVRRHAAEDERIVIVEHEVNKKQGAARNTGLRYSTGDYIMFLDSDDELPKDAVEVLLTAIKKADAQMVYGNMAWMKGDTLLPVEYISKRLENFERYEHANLRTMSAEYWFIGSPCNRMYKRGLLTRNKIEYPEGIFWEDVFFTLLTCFYADVIVFIPDIIYLRTERDDEENQSTTQSFSRKKFLDRDVIDRLVFDFLMDVRNSGKIALDGAISVMDRVMKSTKNMIPQADKDILEWADAWYQEYEAQNGEYVKQLEDAWGK